MSAFRHLLRATAALSAWVLLPSTALAQECRDVVPAQTQMRAVYEPAYLQHLDAARRAVEAAKALEPAKKIGKLSEAVTEYEYLAGRAPCHALHLSELGDIQMALHALQGQAGMAQVPWSWARAAFDTFERVRRITVKASSEVHPDAASAWQKAIDSARTKARGLAPRIDLDVESFPEEQAGAHLDGKIWSVAEAWLDDEAIASPRPAALPGTHSKRMPPGKHEVKIEGHGFRLFATICILDVGGPPCQVKASTSHHEILLAPPANLAGDQSSAFQAAADLIGKHDDRPPSQEEWQRAHDKLDEVIRGSGAAPPGEAFYDRGRCALALGRHTQARGDLDEFLAAQIGFGMADSARKAPPWAVARAERLVKEIERTTASIALQLPPGEASIQIDGTALRELRALTGGRRILLANPAARPGSSTHVKSGDRILVELGRPVDISVTMAGFEPWRRRESRWITAGEQDFQVDLRPLPPPDYSRRDGGIGAFVAGGALVVAGAVLTGFFVDRDEKANQLCVEAGCGAALLAAKDQRWAFLGSSVAAYALGAAGMGVGLYFWAPWSGVTPSTGAGRQWMLQGGAAGIHVAGEF